MESEAALFSPQVLTAFSVCLAAGLATMLGTLTIFRASPSNPRLLSVGLAFAGGAMVYISLVEIFWKSHSSFLDLYADQDAYVAATLAFFAGMLVLVAIDRLVPNPHNELSKPINKDKDYLKSVGLLAAVAITVHNIPEGMATFFSTLEDPVVGSSLAFAIAVHNIPEGISIAIPVYYATNNKKLAVGACFISAIAEPLGALVGYLLLAPFLTPFVFGIVFGMIGGVMVFLSLDELLPAAKRYAKGHDAVYGMVLGMICIALSLVLFR